MNVPQHDLFEIRDGLREIKGQLKELTNRVTVQNGRVGELEERADEEAQRSSDQDDRIAKQDVRITSIEDWQQEHAQWSETMLEQIMGKFATLEASGGTQTGLLQQLVSRVASNETTLGIHDRKLSPRRQLWYGVTQVWDNRRRVTKAVIVVGAVATAFSQIYAVWSIVAERLLM